MTNFSRNKERERESTSSRPCLPQKPADTENIFSNDDTPRLDFPSLLSPPLFDGENSLHVPLAKIEWRTPALLSLSLLEKEEEIKEMRVSSLSLSLSLSLWKSPPLSPFPSTWHLSEAL